MSTKQDVVSEARAHLKRLDDATEEARRVRYEHPAVAMRACSERNAARMLLDEAAPDLLRGLLALVDEQRARLDALAPLAEAAARVREAGTEHERVKALGYRSSEVKRATEWAKTEERLANAALLALALARGER